MANEHGAGLMELLARANDETALVDAESELAVLIAACRMTGRPGKLVVTIKAAPMSKREDCQTMAFSVEVSSKVPKPPSTPAVFYTDRSGQLLTQAPRQADMFDPRRVEDEEDE